MAQPDALPIEPGNPRSDRGNRKTGNGICRGDRGIRGSEGGICGHEPGNRKTGSGECRCDRDICGVGSCKHRGDRGTCRVKGGECRCDRGGADSVRLRDLQRSLAWPVFSCKLQIGGVWGSGPPPVGESSRGAESLSNPVHSQAKFTDQI